MESDPNQNDPNGSNRPDISAHVLPVSATMVGVCLTAIGLVRLVEANTQLALIIDNLIAIDSVFFLLAAVLSYASLRSVSAARRLEGYADMIFLVGLGLMVGISFMLAWELGQSEVTPLIKG